MASSVASSLASSLESTCPFLCFVSGRKSHFQRRRDLVTSLSPLQHAGKMIQTVFVFMTLWGITSAAMSIEHLGKECDFSNKEIYLPSSSKKVANLAALTRL